MSVAQFNNLNSVLKIIPSKSRREELMELLRDGWSFAVTAMTADELRLIIDKADIAYYRPGCSEIMSDSEYDILRPTLKTLDPDDERVTRVGPPFDAAVLRDKVKHRIPMGSLDNTDDGIAGYQPWLTSVSNGEIPQVIASLKVDGGSICATYTRGELTRVATRGNGEIGQDITVNGASFRNLPTVLPEPLTVDVRGEAVMYIADYKEVVERDQGIPFDQIAEENRSNPRNIGNGVFGRDDGQDSDKITFIAFNVEIDGDEHHDADRFETEEHKFEFLRDLGFQPVPYKVCNSDSDFTKFYEQTLEQRDKLPFEIDGIVVTLNSIALHEKFITADPKSRLRPKFSRAVKFPHKANTTTIKDVILSVGHSGVIAPTAVLEQVRIGGVNVVHALLNNWDEIDRLDVAINDEVEVVLSGDIIPKVIRCVRKDPNRVPIVEPARCPCCGGPTTRNLRGKRGAVTYCAQPTSCPEALMGKVDKWIGSSRTGTGILNIGDTILKAMWDNNVIQDAADLYNLKPEDLEDLTLDGGGTVGRSRAETIVNNIQGKKDLTLEVFLGSLGIELLGRRRVLKLREAAGGRLDTLDQWLDTQTFRTLQMEGLGDTIREAIASGIEEHAPLIHRLLSVGVKAGDPPQEAPEAQSATEGKGKPFDGLSFCFTGTRAYMSDTEALGGTIKNSVAKSKPSPDFLVQKDPLSTSNKTKNADANGHTKVISLDYLKKAIDGEVVLETPNGS